MTERRELTGDDIRFLLDDLGARLAGRDVHATIYLVGGAAMALSVNGRRVTDDIDGIFDRSGAIEEVVAEMADEYDLGANWLNSAAGAYVAGGDADATTFEAGGLAISTASPRHLLAMKMAAFRPQDYEDLEALFIALGVATPEEAVDIVWDVYGEYAETVGGGVRVDFLLRARAILERIGDARRSPSPPRSQPPHCGIDAVPAGGHSVQPAPSPPARPRHA